MQELSQRELRKGSNTGTFTREQAETFAASEFILDSAGVNTLGDTNDQPIHAYTKTKDGVMPQRSTVFNSYVASAPKPSSPSALEMNRGSAQSYIPIPVKNHEPDLVDIANK